MDPKRYKMLMRIHGVKVSCPSDTNIFGDKNYFTIEVSKEHHIFIPGEVSGMSQRVGSPLFILCGHDDQTWKHDPMQYTNQEVAFIFQCTEATESIFVPHS